MNAKIDIAVCGPRLASPCLRHLHDNSDNGVNVREDEFLAEVQDMPSKTCEVRIPCSILALASFVVTIIDFDDEADFGASEVHDVVGNNELTTEGKSGLRSGELLPEEMFGTGRSPAHGASALFEKDGLGG